MFTTKRLKKYKISPLQFLGSVAGALSMLSLAQDLNVVSVLGKMEAWLDSYTSLTNLLHAFAFEWIDYRWISISDLEFHVFVLYLIIATSYARAQIQRSLEIGKSHLDSLLMGLSVFFGFAIYFLLFALLLPWMLGLGFSIMLLIWIISKVFGEKSKPPTFDEYLEFSFDHAFPEEAYEEYISHLNEYPPPQYVRDQLIGVLVVFILLLAINYSPIV